MYVCMYVCMHVCMYVAVDLVKTLSGVPLLLRVSGDVLKRRCSFRAKVSEFGGTHVTSPPP